MHPHEGLVAVDFGAQRQDAIRVRCQKWELGRTGKRARVMFSSDSWQVGELVTCVVLQRDVLTVLCSVLGR